MSKVTLTRARVKALGRDGDQGGWRGAIPFRTYANPFSWSGTACRPPGEVATLDFIIPIGHDPGAADRRRRSV